MAEVGGEHVGEIKLEVKANRILPFQSLKAGSQQERGMGANGSGWERMGAEGSAWERVGPHGSRWERV